jgi:type II secretory pathway pseudopilin PulG
MRKQRAFSLIEASVVLFLLGVISATVISGFSAGTQGTSAQLAQVNVGAVMDAAVNIAAGPAGVSSATITAARIETTLPELDIVAAGSAPTTPGQVGLVVDPETSAIATVARADNGSCFYLRIALAGVGVEPSRRYAVTKPASPAPCTANHALDTLVLAAGTTGTSWSNPVVIG